MAEGNGILRLGKTNKRLDAAAIQQGVRKECPFRPEFYVLILPGANYNPRYRKALQNAAIRANGDESAAREDFLSRYEDPAFVVDALVAGMDGIFDSEGEPVPYTPELGLEVLSAPDNADVLQWVVNEAHSYGQFYAKAVEAEAGN